MIAKRSILSVMFAATLVLTGCTDSGPDTDPASTYDSVPYPDGPVTMTAGADPGSGFDLTIRSVVDALQKEKIVETALPVQNRPGGSGADYLATIVEDHRSADDQFMTITEPPAPFVVDVPQSEFDDFSFREVEKQLASFPQYIVEIDGQRIHYLGPLEVGTAAAAADDLPAGIRIVTPAPMIAGRAKANS
ncbi:epoxide hydrolase N-terminal domain-containing protein [Rhodococcoides yunnanense]|uniref:Epoxide hydrolase N-terminal domain-containing protein n=1 Tax=Rhodococcoides yunnanense TaxID=278209 RepID=A0ABU4BJW3_9NOCA|nr:epoxide hydrolase N-terminal domain-containing protein [Rhodococcus yunnanensis]MDV6264368.1 epoxide hydrolase N-terminal domain-containing protein [Rhodococcus yunnanensis]